MEYVLRLFLVRLLMSLVIWLVIDLSGVGNLHFGGCLGI
jgi:hypothetical protein